MFKFSKLLINDKTLIGFYSGQLCNWENCKKTNSNYYDTTSIFTFQNVSLRSCNDLCSITRFINAADYDEENIIEPNCEACWFIMKDKGKNG